MDRHEKINQNLMNIIKRMHDRIEETDVTKARASQEHVARLQHTAKDLDIKEFNIGDMYCEQIIPSFPHTKKKIILYCHGGGYMTGSSLYSRSVTGKLCEATGLEVMAFDYRLSPEHPYPAAIEDSLKAWDYLMLIGYGARDIIVAGDSAGGNLALELTLHLKKQSRMLPLALVLFSPWTDMTYSGKSYSSKASVDPILTQEYIELAVERYAGNADPASPDLSPLFADFTGFPPTLIQVGTNEILYSDSSSLCKKITDAGASAKFESYKGMWHVFQMTPLKTAQDAIGKAAEFIFEKI